METNHSFTSVVLERFPEDEDGKILLESINTLILERKEGTKKKISKKVLTKKQRQREEYRRMKEAEEIGKEIRDKIDKDREKQEKKREKEKTEQDGAKSRPMPSFDVRAAFDASNSRRETTDKQIKVQAVAEPGARPKQRKPIEISGKTQDRDSGKITVAEPGARPKQRKPIEISGKTQDRESGKKKHKDVGCKKNDKARGPIELKPQCRGPASLNVSHAMEGWRPLPDRIKASVPRTG